jgi:hypothetical protein
MHGRPTPPEHLVMPHTGQIVYTSIWAAVVLLFAGYAAIQMVRRRDPLLAVLLVGGAVAYFNEPPKRAGGGRATWRRLRLG